MTPNASKNTLESTKGHTSNYYIINPKNKKLFLTIKLFRTQLQLNKGSLTQPQVVSITRSYASVPPLISTNLWTHFYFIFY